MNGNGIIAIPTLADNEKAYRDNIRHHHAKVTFWVKHQRTKNRPDENKRKQSDTAEEDPSEKRALKLQKSIKAAATMIESSEEVSSSDEM